jgi:F-type H+-transporting ATPase subunit epsilon
MAVFRLNILAPDRSTSFDAVESVVLDASTGSLGIMAKHADILGELGIGTVKIRTAGEEKLLAVAGGFFEMYQGELTILADAYETPGEIDTRRAEEAKARAEERMKKSADIDFDRARIALMRAINRLRVAKKPI